MKLRVVRFRLSSPRHGDDAPSFCECGCGEAYPLSRIVTVPSERPNEFHPVDFIYVLHLRSYLEHRSMSGLMAESLS